MLGRWMEVQLSWVEVDQEKRLRVSPGPNSLERNGQPHTTIWRPEELSALAGDIQDAARMDESLPSAVKTRLFDLHAAIFTRNDGRGTGEVLSQLRGTSTPETLLIRFRTDTLDLKSFPWEALHETPEGPALGVQSRRVVVQRVDSMEPVSPLALKGPMKLLIYAPAAVGLGEALERELADLRPRVEARLIPARNAGWGALVTALAEYAPHALHLIAHGRAGGRVVLGPEPEDAKTATELAQAVQDPTRLVVLESCEGASPGDLMSAAETLASQVGAAVAWRWAIEALTSRRLVATFYKVMLAAASTGRGDIAESLRTARLSMDGAVGLGAALYLRGERTRLFSEESGQTQAPGAVRDGRWSSASIEGRGQALQQTDTAREAASASARPGAGAERPPPPTSKALQVVQTRRDELLAAQEHLVLAGEDTALIDAKLETINEEIERLQLVAKIEALRPPKTERQQFAPGVVLEGRYKLAEVVGRGGFARVWRAFDRATRQIVAVKALREDLVDERGRVERFLRGAREMVKLDHPAIVKVVGAPGEVAGRPYFAMEFLSGGDLAQAFASGERTWEMTLPCLLQIGEALEHAHERGLLHRDVKPQNILLDRTGQAKLTDFDLVRVEETADRSRTKAVGTFLYAAPEMLRGPTEADVRVDVYGLGMTALFAFCSGALPADEVIYDRAGFFQRLACDAGLQAVFERALAYRAQDRFESAQALCRALRESSLDDAQIEASPSARAEVGAPVLVHIPAGRFRMGSPESEAGRWSGEDPQHEVELTNDFWLGAFPVTQDLWQELMGVTPSRFQSPRRPVERVSWFDAVDFCNRLSKRYGLEPAYYADAGFRKVFSGVGSEEEVEVFWKREASGYRLPTEAEWEYACRAGTSGATWRGDLEILGLNNAPLLDEIAWYGGNSGVAFELENGEDSSGWPEKQHEHERAGTRLVGLKSANPWGLYDMLGNVYEWCVDWYAPYAKQLRIAQRGARTEQSRVPTAQRSVRTDPAQLVAGTYRVLRGGSWYAYARDVRAAYRTRLTPQSRYGSLGIRLARGPAQRGGSRQNTAGGAGHRPRRPAGGARDEIRASGLGGFVGAATVTCSPRPEPALGFVSG